MGVDITGTHLLANVSPYDGGYWDGIRIASGSEHNLIKSNLIGGGRFDISLEGGSFNTIQGNTIGVSLSNESLNSQVGIVIGGDSQGQRAHWVKWGK